MVCTLHVNGSIGGTTTAFKATSWTWPTCLTESIKYAIRHGSGMSVFISLIVPTWFASIQDTTGTTILIYPIMCHISGQFRMETIMSALQIFLACVLALMVLMSIGYQASRVVVCEDRQLRGEMMSTLVWMIVSILTGFALIVRW